MFIAFQANGDTFDFFDGGDVVDDFLDTVIAQGLHAMTYCGLFNTCSSGSLGDVLPDGFIDFKQFKESDTSTVTGLPTVFTPDYLANFKIVRDIAIGQLH